MFVVQQLKFNLYISPVQIYRGLQKPLRDASVIVVTVWTAKGGGNVLENVSLSEIQCWKRLSQDRPEKDKHYFGPTTSQPVLRISALGSQT